MDPIKSGYCNRDEEGSLVAYTIFDRKELEDDLGEEQMIVGEELTLEDLAVGHSGYVPFFSGAGRAYGGTPGVKVFKHKVLVYQRRGLDI